MQKINYKKVIINKTLFKLLFSCSFKYLLCDLKLSEFFFNTLYFLNMKTLKTTLLDINKVFIP